MSSKLGENYRKSPGNLVSYDYVDIAEGVGYTKYYGFNQATSGAVVYRLGREQVYSNTIETSGASAAAWNNIKDMDFDIQFNLPKVIKGKVRFNIPYTTYLGGSPSAYIYARVIKVVDSVETVLGDVCSQNYDSTDGNENVINMEVDIAETKFVPTDTLRVNIILQAQSDPASSHAIYHDPMNRSGWRSPAISQLIVQVPFLLDVV